MAESITVKRFLEVLEESLEMGDGWDSWQIRTWNNTDGVLVSIDAVVVRLADPADFSACWTTERHQVEWLNARELTQMICVQLEDLLDDCQAKALTRSHLRLV